MAQFLLFIYSLIIFLSPFLGEAVFKRTETGEIIWTLPCATDTDCPKMGEPMYFKCLNGFCLEHIRELHD
ncbi:Nodule Cysteine-Rich (NCR) secreted peptide [Medicago truncatula]|uniref:Nodule Cysteine-Rich (NCR) secreted peptide n=2 Tax=Medicago truncatula TaxID=3880 RepID=A0A072TTX6_MEDTR|nr:Nodule Cysteine-Rich (NCR) secreted peptide [Medicago truncatula]